MNSRVQNNIEKTGMRLYKLMAKEKPSVFRNEYWLGKMMHFCIQNDEFKTEMFRFIDVYPSLKDTVSIAQHLKEYFGRSEGKMPKTMQWGLKRLKPNSNASKLIAIEAKKNIENIGHQFIVGRTFSEATPCIKGLRDKGIAVTISALGELALSRKDENEYVNRIVELVKEASKIQNTWPALGQINSDLDWGFTPKTNISIKISNLYSQSYNMECSFNYTVGYIKERLRPILRVAKKLNVFIMLDVEHLEWRSLTYETFKSLLIEDEFQEYPHFGIVFQTYYKDSERELDKLFAWSKKRKSKFGIRFVKGGLWDEEVVRAVQRNHSIPVFTNKNETDAVFEKLARKVLKNSEKINLAVGSHNIRSVAAVIETAKELNIPLEKIEFQLLNGMAENMRKAFVKANLNVRIYTPIGDIIPGMAYLVRRLMDNTANHSFLKEDTFGNLSKKDLLKDPADALLEGNDAKTEILTKDINILEDQKFINQPAFSWSPESEADFTKNLKECKKDLPIKVPIIVDKKKLKETRRKQTVNPNKTLETVGKISVADEEDIKSAIDAGIITFDKWKETDIEKRLKYLNKTCSIINKKRNELASMLIYEVGMTWKAAQKEVDDAIDLVSYFLHNLRSFEFEKDLSNIRGENNKIFYEGRGLGLILSSHNSPLSTPIGLITAAIMTGNTVIFSPSTNASVIGYKIYKIFELTNLPGGVLNFIPNTKNEIVDLMANDERVKLIVYSGNRTDLKLYSKIGTNNNDDNCVKKIIKHSITANNAIIVDNDADLDNALKHIVLSAFKYQGQKSCSCSRLIVLADIYDKLCDRLIDIVNSLNFGPTEDSENLIGAVVNEKEKVQFKKMVKQLKKEGKVLIERKYIEENDTGYFVPIVVIHDLSLTSNILQEELIGPLLCVIKVQDFKEALNVANQYRFSLASSIYSRSPMNIRKACKELNAGHIFINQSTCEGYIARQEWVAYDASGIGNKTEVTEFFKEFMVMKALTENTIRKGYSPA